MKHTGPGRIQNQPTHPPSLLLYNFDVDGCRIKPEHERALLNSVVPTLRAGGSATIVGLASRTGHMGHNDRLSLDRATSVLTALKRNIPSGFRVGVYSGVALTRKGVYGVGERKAKQEGYRDGTEDARFRSAVVFVTHGSTPPPPRVPDNVMLRELPVITGGSGVLDTVGKVLDTLTSGSSVINLVLEIPLLDLGGEIVAALSTILGLPAVWLSGNNLAERNGKILGFSRAMQFMADAFADYDLRDKDESHWPAVPFPRPQFPNVPEQLLTVAEKSARSGERQGYELAFHTIMQLDASPKIVPVKIKGHTQNIRLSGRQYLWYLRYFFGDDVKQKLQRQLESLAH